MSKKTETAGSIIQASSSLHAAVLFHRVGPYHFARLRQAGRAMRITAVEFSGKDETYAWDQVTGADSFQRVTLFEQADSHSRPVREVMDRVRLALEESRPDVVAIPGWSDCGALAALKWCVTRRVPAVVMSETTAWDDPRRAWREWVKRRLVRLYSGALAGGRANAEYLVKLGMPAERVFLGYDAIDNEHFSQGVKAIRRGQMAGKDKQNLPEQYFLASARFIEKKNLPGLLQAYAGYRRLCGEGGLTPWHLVLLGDGELRSALLTLRGALGLETSVHLPGFKQYPELPIYYGLAQAFIHASTAEPWGLVVNEAMASGLPVLVSNRCGCARDLVQHGRNGFGFDPHDPDQLARLMLRLMRLQPGERAAMGLASQEIIADWGPERFGRGLRRASELAVSALQPRVDQQQRLLLNLLCQQRLG